MKVLEEAQKKYWYDQGFDKWDSHWQANTELCVFAEGWKAALEWVLSKSSIDPLWQLDNYTNKENPHKIILNKEINDIKKELNDEAD